MFIISLFYLFELWIKDFAKISEYHKPNDQKSLNDQKMYAKQLRPL